MKKVIIDFETTGANPTKAKIIEACFMFVEDRKIVKTFTKKISLFTADFLYMDSRVNSDQIKSKYRNFDVEELAGLKFNNINSLEDYGSHERGSVYFYDFFKEVKDFYNEFREGKKLPLTGWNNAAYDNLILKRYIENFEELFDYHTRDVMHDFRRLRELMNDNRGLSLKHVHKETIGTIKDKDFHKAETDCLAVKDLDEWFEDFFSNVELKY